MRQAYRESNKRNAESLSLEGDLVMVHDPQPAALIEHRKDGKWIWRCHLDLSQPQRRAWSFIRRFVLRYDAAIFSLNGFAQRLPLPKFLIYPSIDPLSLKNRELPRAEVNQVMERLGIPRDKPILLEISPFERVKDQLGTLRAYRLVKKYHNCRLVLAGGVGANTQLRAALDAAARQKGFEVFYPELALCTDNGAMIAFAAALRLQAGKAAPSTETHAFSVRPR